MPIFEYSCPEHGIFEEIHSYKIVLTHCPTCQENGKEQEIVKLMSLGARGVVELYGDDLVAKVKSDAQQLKKDAARDEKLYSNLIGENHYQKLQTNIDKNKR
jgi:putative FmdB family regulatory protein